MVCKGYFGRKFLFKRIRFILTKWYVKNKAILVAVYLLITFYINYVVCKANCRCIWCTCSRCFILTVWNVNTNAKYQGYKKQILYQLCGM
ncbi:hypothetical protein CUB07_10395 [Clostridioides difficile]|nr:hypothetical protein [Clostridioides difficile]